MSAPLPTNPSKLANTKSSSDTFWNTYLNQAKEEDAFLPNSWEANTGGILTFTGLFAATVAAFLIESYKSLSPDSGDRTVALLEQLLSATVNTSTNTSPSLAFPEPFRAARTTVAVNSLWFSSLLISLVCALLSTLIQEWARDYRRDINRRQTLNESVQDCAFNHIYVRMGIDRYGMDGAVYLVTALVHLSVLLFALGLIIFLWPIDQIVASVVIGVLGVFSIVYAMASVLPLFDQSCPYRTPVTYLLTVIILTVYYPIAFCISKSSEEILSLGSAIRTMNTRSVSDYTKFLNSTRFAFAWDRTSRHMMKDEEQHMNLLESLGTIINDHDQNNVEQFAHIWFDGLFFVDLPDHFELILRPDSATRQPVKPIFFQVVAALFNGLFVVDNNRIKSGAIYWSQVFFFFVVLEKTGRILQVSEDAETKHAARLCHASVVGSCLRARVLARRRGVGIPDQWPDLALDNDGDLHVVMRLPFDIVQARWIPANLVPLHAGECCRLPPSSSVDAEQHAFASNALTAIALLLDADPAVRASVGIPAWLRQFDETFNPSPALKRHIPSEQFIGVLRTAGLEEWLQPGSDFSSVPNRTSVYFHYYLNDGWPLWWILRHLAQGVNWRRYHRLHPAGNRPTASSSVTTFVTANQSASHTDDPSNSPYSASLIAPACLSVVVDSSGDSAARAPANSQGVPEERAGSVALGGEPASGAQSGHSEGGTLEYVRVEDAVEPQAEVIDEEEGGEGVSQKAE